MDPRPLPDDRREADGTTTPDRRLDRIGSTASSGGAPTVEAEIFHRTSWTYRLQLPACWTAYWGTLLANWSFLLTLSLLFEGLEEALGEPALSEFLRFLSFLAGIIIPIWLQIGMNLSLLKVARGEPTEFVDLFRGGRFLLTTILSTLLVVGIALIPASIVHFSAEKILDDYPTLSFLLGLAASLSAAGVPEPILGSLNGLLSAEWDNTGGSLILAFIVASSLGTAMVLVVLARLGQFSYLILDQGRGVLGSLRSSWRLTRGRVIVIILVYLAQMMINLAGFLFFCIGLFFTLPLTSLLMAVTYHVFNEHSPEREQGIPESWEGEAEGAS